MRITFGVIVNHFDKVIRQIFLALRIIFGRCELLSIWIRQLTVSSFFLFLTPLRQNFPLFRQILCIGCKNAYKLRIKTRKCESHCQSMLLLRREYKKKGASLFISKIHHVISYGKAKITSCYISTVYHVVLV